jgi:hypothetical protein
MRTEPGAVDRKVDARVEEIANAVTGTPPFDRKDHMAPRLHEPAEPRPPVDPAALPHALTFFLTARQRAAVLRRLKRFDADRRTALLAALDVVDASDEVKRCAMRADTTNTGDAHGGESVAGS